jgi:hypothetical protein
MLFPKKLNSTLGMVVHACKSNYSEGRNRRISSWRPTQVKVMRPYLRNKI